MNFLYISTTTMCVGLFIAAPAFAQTPSATKQRTEAWGGLSCNLVADAKDDPECVAYLKNKTQNLTPSPLEATEEPAGHRN
jgi:hypothetical protein